MNLRINSEPLNQKRNLSRDEACTYTGLGRNTMMALCEKIGAVHKVGRRVLIDRVIVDRYFDNLAAGQAAGQEK